MLKTDGDMLVLNQIRFDSDIRKPEGLKIPADGDLAEKEIEIAIMLIDQLSSPFKPEDFKDTFRGRYKQDN